MLTKNKQLASDVPRLNLLQNGGFEQWHYGYGPFASTGGASANSGLITADRWQAAAIGTDTLSVSRNTANQDVGSVACAACTFVLGNGGGTTTLNQLLPYTDGAQLVGRTVTMVLRVRCATANAVRAGVYNGTTWTYSPYHSGSGLYETLVVPGVVILAAAAASGVYAALSFTASCTAYVDNATLVQGDHPADYVPALSYPDALPNERVGSDVNRATLLVNGGFERWQRGAGPFTTSWCADRWSVYTAGGSTLSVSSDTSHPDNPSLTNAACTYAHVGGGVGQLYQLIETMNYLLRGRAFTFAVRVQCATAGAVRLFADGATAGRVYGGYNSGGAGYETLFVTCPGVSGSVAVQVGIELGASCTAYVDNATLVQGVVPADYVTAHPTDEFARCLRYYHIAEGNANDGSLNLHGYANGALTAYVEMGTLPVVMAVNPTMTKNGTWSVTNMGQPVPLGNRKMWSLQCPVSAAGMFYTAADGAGKYVAFEANP